MKKQIIITLVLLMATAYVTIVYFKNLNPPGSNTNRALNTIPDNTPLIFEFNNDGSFYDIFKNDTLFNALAGRHKLGELDTLKQQLLQNPVLYKFFIGQNIFISVYPSETENIDLLFTLAAVPGMELPVLSQLTNQSKSGLIITQLQDNGKQGYSIYISALKKRFYVLQTGKNIYSGSFSKKLIDETADYLPRKNRQSFILLPEQENANSLANIYVNYSQLNFLFSRLFLNKNTDIFKSFRHLPGLASLSMNYKTNALMFNGETTIQLNEAESYLNLFASQQPVTNHLKDILPSTTAYCTDFAVSDPGKFEKDLTILYKKAGIKKEEDQLFSKIDAETGPNLKSSFSNLLGNEFSIVTTRYFEKLAIINVKDGSKMNALLTNISKMTDENSGQFNYDKLPFFLLGDAFSVLKRPYFLIIDNYLVLANSPGELKSYNDSYLNQKFLSKNNHYNQFDNLLAAQSNVAFLLIIKNAAPIFKTELNEDIYRSFQNNDPGWQSFYGAAWQLTAADKNFYTNFCLRLNTDTAMDKN